MDLSDYCKVQVVSEIIVFRLRHVSTYCITVHAHTTLRTILYGTVTVADLASLGEMMVGIQNFAFSIWMNTVSVFLCQLNVF
jgi:hypothetical protein